VGCSVNYKSLSEEAADCGFGQPSFRFSPAYVPLNLLSLHRYAHHASIITPKNAGSLAMLDSRLRHFRSGPSVRFFSVLAIFRLEDAAVRRNPRTRPNIMQSYARGYLG